MAYNVEFDEPYYDHNCDQWVLQGFLHLRIENQEYRTLTIKHWLSHEARFTHSWFVMAKQAIKRELEERADREIRAAFQYRPPAPATFTRLTIPLIRRVYPQLIANQIVSVQPMTGPTTLQFYERFRRARVPKHNWKEEGF